MIGVALVAQQGEKVVVENRTAALSSSYQKAFALVFMINTSRLRFS
jgi:hypothetical protein